MKRGPLLALALVVLTGAGLHFSGLPARAAEAIGFGKAAQPDLGLTGQFTQGGWARGVAPRGIERLALDGKPGAIAGDGRFFVAFDRDSGARSVLTAALGDGRSATYDLVIAPRAWQIEHIPLGPRPGTPPSEEFARRRAAETRIAAQPDFDEYQRRAVAADQVDLAAAHAKVALDHRESVTFEVGRRQGFGLAAACAHAPLRLRRGVARPRIRPLHSVSYTHLTLPTSDLV